MPREKIKALVNGSFTKKTAATKKRTPILIAMIETCLVNISSSFSKGLCTSFMVCVKFAILPNSVFMPIDRTKALAEPLATLVPVKIRFEISYRERSSLKSGS